MKRLQCDEGSEDGSTMTFFRGLCIAFTYVTLKHIKIYKKKKSVKIFRNKGLRDANISRYKLTSTAKRAITAIAAHNATSTNRLTLARFLNMISPSSTQD